jgi:hypothetical protein
MMFDFEESLKDWLAKDNLIGIDYDLFDQKIKSNLNMSSQKVVTS